MINAITSTPSISYSAPGSSAELATLQKELLSYQKQLTQVENGPVNLDPVHTQLLAAQVSLLTSQIVSLSGVTPVSFTEPLANTTTPPQSVPTQTTVAVSAATHTAAASSAPNTSVPASAPTGSATSALVSNAATQPDEATLSQAKATLSAIFEKATVAQPGTPGTGTSTQSTASSTQSGDTEEEATNANPVGSTINLLV
jgi:hypothetical protein